MPNSQNTATRCPLLLFAAIFLAVATVLVAASFALDGATDAFVRQLNGGHWCRVGWVSFLSLYGDWPELMLLGGFGYVVAHLLRNTRWKRIILCAMIASTLAGMTINLSRLTTGRTRPRAAAEQGWYGPRHDAKWLIGEADFNSFPSGHTATAFGFAGVFLFAAPSCGIPLMVAAISIAASRILLGAHHLSDVVAAMLVATLIAWLVWNFLGRRGRNGNPSVKSSYDP